MKKINQFWQSLIKTFLITEPSKQKTNNRSIDNTTLQENMNLYDSLIAANEKYGSNKENICKSNFKCAPNDISENVIIAPTWEVNIFKDHVNNIKHIAGPTGHGYDIYELSICDKKVTYIITGVGACNLIDAVLALGCTPCRKILFIGSVGALDENMQIGDIVIPEYSVCGVGANRYLTHKNVIENDSFGKKYYPNKEFSNKVKRVTAKIINNTDIKLHFGRTFSTDTIFAQFAHLKEFINIGCNTIEMETATLFNAANIVGIKAAAVCNISDNTMVNKSLYSGRTNDEQQRRLKVKKDIIPKIVLDVLKK